MAYSFSGTFAGGGTNTFVPTLLSNGFRVEFSRNPESFAVNRYTQNVPVGVLAGYYLTLDSTALVRVVTAQDFVWPLGNDRPRNLPRKHAMTAFATQRYNDTEALPYETVDVSQWDITNANMRMLATRMMTLRTINAVTALVDSNLYPSTAYAATAGAIGTSGVSGSWYTSTAAQAYIQQGIQYVCSQILQNTSGGVRQNDILMVMNPTTARKVAASPEVQSYVKNYGAALAFMQGDPQFSNWGLPSKLWDVGVVIEDSVRESGREGDTASLGYSMADNKVAFVSRPGGLMGVSGAPSFSTISNFVYEDFNTEIFDDPKNRRHEGSITDNYVYKMTAPISGYLCASVAS